MEHGSVLTPYGRIISGWKVTIDDGLPPAKQDYVQERVGDVLGKLEKDYRVTRLSNTHLIVETI